MRQLQLVKGRPYPPPPPACCTKLYVCEKSNVNLLWVQQISGRIIRPLSISDILPDLTRCIYSPDTEAEFLKYHWQDVGTRSLLQNRVSYETNFDSKQPKLEPKLVSILSETRRLFRLFRLNIETGSFGVSNEPKQQENNRNKPKKVLTLL
jgi:hypothetical protein